MLDIEERHSAVVLHMRQVPANVLSAPMLRRLAAAVEFVESSRPLVLTGYRATFAVGEGPRGAPYGATDAEAVLAAQHDALRLLIERSGPVVTAINGDALDAGFALAAAADIRLMARGVVGISGHAADHEALGPVATSLITGTGPHAERMLGNGGVLTADEAAATGFIHHRTTPCRLLDEAIVRATTIAPVS